MGQGNVLIARHASQYGFGMILMSLCKAAARPVGLVCVRVHAIAITDPRGVAE